MTRPRLSWTRRGGWHARWRGHGVWGYGTPWGAAYGAWQLAASRRRPGLVSRAGRPMPWWRFRTLAAANYWHRWRLRHPLRKSALQRDFESGDPARLARVEAAAAQVIAELGRDSTGAGS